MQQTNRLTIAAMSLACTAPPRMASFVHLTSTTGDTHMRTVNCVDLGNVLTETKDIALLGGPDQSVFQRQDG